PADAGQLMTAALQYDDPVIFMEHKFLSETALEFLGSGGRKTVSYDLPVQGVRGPVPQPWFPLPFGKAILRRNGDDLTIVSVGVGVHRARQAAEKLAEVGLSAGVLDLRSIAPLDKEALFTQVTRTQHLLVVDEDYEQFGLSGELAALVMETGIRCKYKRVCTQTTIPYARKLEENTLPNVERITAGALQLMETS
ncbi:MAG: pyruvate dehydrogenase, partial [Anaerolineales bacterium]